MEKQQNPEPETPGENPVQPGESLRLGLEQKFCLGVNLPAEDLPTRHRRLGLTLLDASKLVRELGDLGYHEFSWTYPPDRPDEYVITALPTGLGDIVPDETLDRATLVFYEYGATHVIEKKARDPESGEDVRLGILMAYCPIHWEDLP